MTPQTITNKPRDKRQAKIVGERLLQGNTIKIYPYKRRKFIFVVIAAAAVLALLWATMDEPKPNLMSVDYGNGATL